MALILVVDSDFACVNLTAAVLRDDNHSVCTAMNAADAFRIITSAEFIPQLLIVNPELKRISGLQLVASLRPKAAKIAVLFMSDNSGISEVLKRAVGANSVIQGPFSAAALRKAVCRRLRARDREKLVD